MGYEVVFAPDRQEVWGRPVAVLQIADGSLLVSDDGGNKLWRVSDKGRTQVTESR